MEESFHGINFAFEKNRPVEGGFSRLSGLSPIIEVQIAGEDGPIDARQFNTSEKRRLMYVSHEISENELVIVQRSELIETRSHFVSFEGGALRTYTEVKNISDKEIILEHVSSFFCGNIAERKNTDKIFLYCFTNSHHAECQPRKISLFELGLFPCTGNSKKRVYGSNTGSQSTKEELAQFILQDETQGKTYMFQIESNSNWYWEIGESRGNIYLNCGGGNMRHNGWHKTLAAGESFLSPFVAFARGETVAEVVDAMTLYRRQIVIKRFADENLPTIFNEYMHLSWDSPNEKRTARIAPEIAKLGIDYYVIDCGWHNEEPGERIYPYVGKWKESKTRFPKGIKHTIDLIHSCGMKAGLWLEPEIVGMLCAEMINFYPDDVWLKRFGKPVISAGRRFLDFRNRAVLKYMNGIIDRLLGEYGVDYLKFDYNQDSGGYLDGDGDILEQIGQAFLDWVDGIIKKYPNVIIEACASGGMRMDYKTLSHFSITSTSDQIKYKKYPYIAGNILSAVLPEQAAVWSYPVDSYEKELPNDEAVVMNMINTFLGRMHLASDITRLTNAQKELVKEGIKYYNSLTQDKKKALPYMPLGFTDFSQKLVASGLKTDKKIYLAVWNLSDENRTVNIPVRERVKNITVGYPKNLPTDYSFENNSLTVRFSAPYSARFFEMETK